MKKILVITIVSLLLISVLIFPAMATINENSVSWDAYPVWPTSLSVYGYVCIYDYSGETPTAYFTGETNLGESIDVSVSGIGCARSITRICGSSIPLLIYWDSGIVY